MVQRATEKEDDNSDKRRNCFQVESSNYTWSSLTEITLSLLAPCSVPTEWEEGKQRIVSKQEGLKLPPPCWLLSPLLCGSLSSSYTLLPEPSPVLVYMVLGRNWPSPPWSWSCLSFSWFDPTPSSVLWGLQITLLRLCLQTRVPPAPPSSVYLSRKKSLRWQKILLPPPDHLSH